MLKISGSPVRTVTVAPDCGDGDRAAREGVADGDRAAREGVADGDGLALVPAIVKRNPRPVMLPSLVKRKRTGPE
jgi:hypothetical protein